MKGTIPWQEPILDYGNLRPSTSPLGQICSIKCKAAWEKERIFCAKNICCKQYTIWSYKFLDIGTGSSSERTGCSLFTRFAGCDCCCYIMLAFCHTLSSCFLKTTLMGHSLHPKKGDSTDWLSFGETISYSLFWKLKLVLTDNRAIYSDNHHIYYTQMRISDVCLKDLKLKTAVSDHF